MIRTCLILLSCLFFSFVVQAQSRITGSVVDTIADQKIANAVVALIGVKDSVLYKFVRTDREGKFQIRDVRGDSFILQVSHPDFADYVDILRVSQEPQLAMGTIFITPKSKLLEEVIVRQNLAVRIKGDTIEYKADSFKTEEGASVKDLLRKFPGITVDRDGKITAQGQTVNRVLVDGEEFFSDDPAVVIENLRADAIDKVQSFDKKSEQAEFTGVDDGKQSKTLNLVLKEDKKKGMMGKVVIGGGTMERYSNQAMLQFFKGKQKIAAYAIMSNTGVTGLGWNDRDNFGGGGNADMEDADMIAGAGFIMTFGGGDDDFSDWSNNYYDEGIPQTFKAGAHYSNKWNKDREKLNGSYSMKNLRVNAIGNSLTKFTLPGSSYYSRESHNSLSRERDQLFSGLYDFRIDSMASIRMKVNGRINQKESDVFTTNETLTDSLDLLNRNQRSNTMDNLSTTLAASALWRQKFRKVGRTFSLTAAFKQARRDQEGFLRSNIDYFKGGINYFQDSTDQFKDYITTTNTSTAKAVYTEAAGKKGIIEFNYVFSRTNSESDRKTFDAVDGKYTSLNDSFSIKYALEYFVNNAGIKYQYNGKKLVASLGGNFGLSRYIQKDSMDRRVRVFDYYNLLPMARVTYKMAAQRSLVFNYAGTPQAPSVNQLQPIIENNDPLFIVVGNPELKQAFNHQISTMFMDYKVLSGRSIWAMASFNPVQNAIVTNRSTNDSGRTTQQYFNTQGNFSYYGSFNYGFRLQKSQLNIGIDTRINGSRYVSMINGVMNSNLQNRFTIGPGISKYKEGKYEFWANADVSYNFSSSTTQSLNANFWSQQHQGNFTWFLTKRFQMGSTVVFYLRERNDAFQENNNFTIWDAQVSYKVFKKRNGVFRFEVKDILKERRGYERVFSNDMIRERNYNQLTRYGLLSFTWNFTKSPAGATPAQ